jgi:hypothetical protein
VSLARILPLAPRSNPIFNPRFKLRFYLTDPETFQRSRQLSTKKVNKKQNETNFVQSLNKSNLNLTPFKCQLPISHTWKSREKRLVLVKIRVFVAHHASQLAASFNDIATVMKRSSELAASFAQSLLGSDAFEVLQHLQQGFSFLFFQYSDPV